MTTTYEFIRDHDNVNTEQFFKTRSESRTRGHTWRSSMRTVWRVVCKHFFGNRVVDFWNKLSEKEANASTTEKFKNRHDRNTRIRGRPP